MIHLEIIKKVKELEFPERSYVVFGSCPLALAGIREANDIDMLVTLEVWRRMKLENWKELDKGGSDRPLVHDVFEMHTNWNFSSYNPTLEELLVNATFVDGVAFASLNEVRKWKVLSGRPKDLADIALIDSYLLKS